jgi:hypothetical protein
MLERVVHRSRTSSDCIYLSAGTTFSVPSMCLHGNSPLLGCSFLQPWPRANGQSNASKTRSGWLYLILSSRQQHSLPTRFIRYYRSAPDHALGMASWKRSLCDGGLHDCLRAYLIPCCVFGQTRYRLERIECHENPLDLEGYRSSNGPCWDWFFFALPLGNTAPSARLSRGASSNRHRRY